MPASEVRCGPASPEEQVASEQVSSLPALWRPGPQALVPLQEVLRGATLAERKQEPGPRGVLLVSTYESTGKRCLAPLMSRPLLPRSVRSFPYTFSDLAWGDNVEPGLELGHHGDSPAAARI